MKIILIILYWVAVETIAWNISQERIRLMKDPEKHGFDQGYKEIITFAVHLNVYTYALLLFGALCLIVFLVRKYFRWNVRVENPSESDQTPP